MMKRYFYNRSIATFLAALFFAALHGAFVAADATEPQVRRVIDFASSDAMKLVDPESVGGFESGYSCENGIFRCEGSTEDGKGAGVVQFYQLDQKSPDPICATCWSRAEGVGGASDGDYSLYLDIKYSDGEALWGQFSPFLVGDSNWNRVQVVVFPEKPIKSLNCFALFRHHSGVAYFKDLSLYAPKVPGESICFDGAPIAFKTSEKNAPSILLRDVGANGDFLEFDAEAARSGLETDDLNLRLKSQKFGDGPYEELSLTVSSLTDKDRALTIVYATPFPQTTDGAEFYWFGDPRDARKIEKLESIRASNWSEIGAGRLSRYPLGVVSQIDAQGNERAFGLAIDPDRPAFYRIAANGASRELYIAFDVALTRERPSVDLRFLPLNWKIASDALSVEPCSKDALDGSAPNVPAGSNGFRAALDAYRQLFPKRFEVRAVKQGLWMAFSKVSNVKGWEDFGFQFKEGDNELQEDDAKGLTSFRYTEPTTYWQSLPEYAAEEEGRERGLALARKNAVEKNSPEARALLTSGIKDENGAYYGITLKTPWCNGVVWSVNEAPGLVDLVASGKLGADGEKIEPLAGFALKWNDELADRLYGAPLEKIKSAAEASREELENAQTMNGLDGEYIDSSEGYVTAKLDYAREHFKGASAPLVYSARDKRPAIFRGLILFEYARKMAEDVHARGKLMMANSTPSDLFWLTPQLDVLGTETNWNYMNKWSPMTDDDALYRRALCCGKPYCFLMNTVFSDFSIEHTEAYMKRSLAYGFFPGFFSADASTDCYFEDPKYYERDRELFKRYVPLCKSVAEAGWEPETGARSNDDKIYVERFGAIKGARVASNPNAPSDAVYLTIFNDSEEERGFEIELSDALLRHIESVGAKTRDLTNDAEITLEGNVLRGSLQAFDVKVVEIAR